MKASREKESWGGHSTEEDEPRKKGKTGSTSRAHDRGAHKPPGIDGYCKTAISPWSKRSEEVVHNKVKEERGIAGDESSRKITREGATDWRGTNAKKRIRRGTPSLEGVGVLPRKKTPGHVMQGSNFALTDRRSAGSCLEGKRGKVKKASIGEAWFKRGGGMSCGRREGETERRVDGH